MQSLIPVLARHAELLPEHIAIEAGRQHLNYRQLHAAVTDAAARLRASTRGPVALAVDNGPAWITGDLAVLAGDMPCVPLPPFFTPAQQFHALCDAGAGWLLTDRPDFHDALLRQHAVPAARVDDIELGGITIAQFCISGPQAQLPPGTAKVTYTSGTTGAPKGACLSATAINNVALALAAATGMTADDRHLCLLPLATLLENIGGIYAPLLSGGCVVYPPGHRATDASATGMHYGATLAHTLAQSRATTAIMVPQMLQALVAAVETGTLPPPALRFLAVGGARVPPALLQRAAQAGLPAFEGYGLSECASVVALNTPQANRPGSVGRPLPHAGIQIAGDGEILVSGAGFLGYAGSTAAAGAGWHTGDIGHLDADGYLHLTGRKKDLFITAFGRNVSPEWVEGELTLQPAISQAWVHGEARPWNTAVIVARTGASTSDIENAITAANHHLPGYAQLRHWLPASEAFSCKNGELTSNGRLRRSVIAARYAANLEALYSEQTCELS